MRHLSANEVLVAEDTAVNKMDTALPQQSPLS